MKISEVLAFNFKSLRESNKKSVIAISEDLGVTRQTIYNIESGKGWIALPLVKKACKYFKIEEHELFQTKTNKPI